MKKINNQNRKEEFNKRRIYKGATSFCNVYECPIFQNCLLDINNLKQALNEIREYIHSEEFFMLMNSGSIIDPPKDKPIGEDYFKAQGKLDKIIDKYLGGSEDEN